MSKQVPDPFIWIRKKDTADKSIEAMKCFFIGADNVYELFDPSEFGLKPESPNTACMKGFILEFLLKDDKLFLEKLSVHTSDDDYPLINGIEASPDGKYNMHEYRDLHMPLAYTGTVYVVEGYDIMFEIISRKLGEDFSYNGPYFGDPVYGLDFTDGNLTGYKQTGEYSRF